MKSVECLRQEMTIQIKAEAPKKCTNVARRSRGRGGAGHCGATTGWVGWQVVSVEATTPAYVTFALPLNMKLIMKLCAKFCSTSFEKERKGGREREREREEGRGRKGVGQLKLSSRAHFWEQVQRAYKKTRREEKLLARLAMSLGKIKYTPRGP